MVVVVASFSGSSLETWKAGAAGASDVDAAGGPLADLSFLKTLLMRFTYLPKLLRRSWSFVLEGPGGGDDMITIDVQWASPMSFNSDQRESLGKRDN